MFLGSGKPQGIQTILLIKYDAIEFISIENFSNWINNLWKHTNYREYYQLQQNNKFNRPDSIGSSSVK